jgi:UDPglucose 6-dehydrogenase
MNIVIIGTGYVGLVTGVCLANIGHRVTCVDVDVKKIKAINSGFSPFFEFGLDDLLRKNIKSGNLRSTSDLKKAFIGADVSIIAVGTPFDGTQIDLKFIRQAAKDIAKVLIYASDYHVVCVKSTVIPGTTENVVGKIISEESGKKLGIDFGLCMNPEFLAEGTAVSDFMNPDRIIIGAIDERSCALIKLMYEYFSNVDIITTTPATAEMSKYASNAFFATVISYANEIANLSSQISGVDIVDVLNSVYKDRRLSPITPSGRIIPGFISFLYPGTGFGGSCFPKDVKAITSYGLALEQPMDLLQATLKVNIAQPDITINLIRHKLGILKNKRITILGLAFKPGTDDVRETPAFAIIKSLLKQKAVIAAHDPIAINSMKLNYPNINIEYFNDAEDALKNTDAIVLVTSWPEYKLLLDKIKFKDIPIIDGRRFLDKKKYSNYSGIGLAKH